ncbi:hypothetical protein C4D60_Mb09t26210 [Musa balbisiana]|uniref:Uncharacterized protein n=1 Tax=Musa balbisiana TaxID=52838 RepID=A0A4S8IJ96_MUSBA|nr:hypothetical protein C4D60_Mb09t26210 [Musa balbisiana]
MAKACDKGRALDVACCPSLLRRGTGFVPEKRSTCPNVAWRLSSEPVSCLGVNPQGEPTLSNLSDDALGPDLSHDLTTTTGM